MKTLNLKIMKRSGIVMIILLASVLIVRSQNAVDALRYSKINIGGTARYMGLGGAFGSLGADFTSSSVNPAGLGLYKSSEFTITPSLFFAKTSSVYNGMTGQDLRSNFYLGDAGMVMTSKLNSKPGQPGWKYVQFATGVNRLKDFNYRIDIRGTNNQNSLLDTYLESANSINYNDIEQDPNGDYAFDLNPAWWTFLLDTIAPYNNLYTDPIPAGSNILQSKTISTRGSMNEWVFSIGANYNDRLYLGATIGLPWIRYYESSVYTESDYTNSINDFKQFNRYEDLETRGNGFNFKFGFIYRISDMFRIGGAIHTPSWFSNMRDSWTVSMNSYFDNGDNYSKSSPAGNYHYTLTTPLRATGSLGIIFGNAGLISADYEFANYGTARLDGSDYNFGMENTDIRNSYRSTHQIRLGTEWRYNIFSFRGGYNYTTSPYKNSINDGKSMAFSLGLGMKQSWFFLDLAYVYSIMKEDYYLYSSQTVYTNPVKNDYRTNNVLLTLGAKF
jgi:hypothetical protein